MCLLDCWSCLLLPGDLPYRTVLQCGAENRRKWWLCSVAAEFTTSTRTSRGNSQQDEYESCYMYLSVLLSPAAGQQDFPTRIMKLGADGPFLSLSTKFRRRIESLNQRSIVSLRLFRTSEENKYITIPTPKCGKVMRREEKEC